MVNAKPFQLLIQELHAQGFAYTELARITGVHYNTLRHIANRPRHSLYEPTAEKLQCLVDLLPQENL